MSRLPYIDHAVESREDFLSEGRIELLAHQPLDAGTPESMALWDVISLYSQCHHSCIASGPVRSGAPSTLTLSELGHTLRRFSLCGALMLVNPIV